MSDCSLVFRVVDWDLRYESRGSLRQRGPRDLVPVQTDLGRAEIQRLLDSPGGFSAFGVWNIIWRLAARCQRRGALVEQGVPLSVEELARVSRCPVPLVEQAVALLCSPGIGLLEQVSVEEALRPPVIPPPLPRKPRKPQPRALARCPVCDADLTVLDCRKPVQPSDAPDARSNPIHRVEPFQDEPQKDGQECRSFITNVSRPPMQRVAPPQFHSQKDGQECPSNGVAPGSVSPDGPSSAPRLEPRKVEQSPKPRARHFSPFRVRLAAAINVRK